MCCQNFEKMTECIITKSDPQTVANGYRSAKLENVAGIRGFSFMLCGAQYSPKGQKTI